MEQAMVGTVEQFCELLKVHRGKRVWQILRDEGDPACYGPIRGRTPRGYRRDCPVTFLAHVLTGRRHYPAGYLAAARRLGIPGTVAHAIANASDASDTEHQGIRTRILRALEL